VAEFNAIDWKEKGAALHVDEKEFNVLASAYSPGCTATARLVSAATVSALASLEANGAILLLHGEIAKEQLMPKNFVFYNPEEHQEIIALLEKSGAKAIVCATGRNSALAGGAYPFPLIEDGDFNIPSVYMTEEEGARLLPFVGKQARLTSVAERIPSKGYNVIGKEGNNVKGKIVITAHIDAKKGTPGAIDNATGVSVLLLIAELLREYNGDKEIEIVALNGEDYYAVPGQMSYIAANQNTMNTIILNINIDGAGYKEGLSAFSFFDLPPALQKNAEDVMRCYPGITEGAQWPQGDHSIFVHYGRPALAVSSKWFIDNMSTQDITHTPKDSMEIVDHAKLVEIAEAIHSFVVR
jgi:aminopeptidase YwaD